MEIYVSFLHFSFFNERKLTLTKGQLLLQSKLAAELTLLAACVNVSQLTLRC